MTTKTKAAPEPTVTALAAAAAEAAAEAEKIRQDNAAARQAESDAAARASQLRQAEIEARTRRSLAFATNLVHEAPALESDVQHIVDTTRTALIVALQEEPWFQAAVEHAAARLWAFSHRSRLDGATTEVTGMPVAPSYTMPPEHLDPFALVLGMIVNQSEALVIDWNREWNTATARYVEGTSDEPPVHLADARRLSGETMPSNGDSHGLVSSLANRFGYDGTNSLGEHQASLRTPEPQPDIDARLDDQARKRRSLRIFR